jgi:23S rRNA (pseudouridine1915-N3)-methyltransferase
LLGRAPRSLLKKTLIFPNLVKITIACIGKTKHPATQSLSDEYLKRLQQFAEVDGVSLKDEAALLKLSGLEGKSPRRYLVLLDSRGKQLSSEELAQFMRSHQDRNPTPLVFAIGPADGFAENTRNRADFTLSLGKMTIAHELARAVLLEQLYRAFTILKGHPYHLGH